MIVHPEVFLLWKQISLLSRWVCLSQLKPSRFYILSSKVYTTFLAEKRPLACTFFTTKNIELIGVYPA